MNEEIAMKNASKYVEWVARHGRTPKRPGDNDVERKLNAWMTTYRRSGLPCSNVNKYLTDNLGKTVTYSREDKSVRMAMLYVAFCIKNNRYPCMRLDRGNAMACKLVNWFDSYRRGIKSGGPTVEYDKTTSILKRYLGDRIFDSRRVFKIHRQPAVCDE